MKNKERLSVSVFTQLFIDNEKNSVSAFGAFEQTYFHLTFREKCIPLLVFACALSPSPSFFPEPAAKSERKPEC